MAGRLELGGQTAVEHDGSGGEGIGEGRAHVPIKPGCDAAGGSPSVARVDVEQTELTGAATWRDPAWREPALAWARDRLAERGIPVTGQPEQVHVRAWSTAIRIPVDRGAVWLKSVGTGSAQEPVLAEVLGAVVPDRVLVPLAVDRPRRLSLLPDGGTTLRASGGGRRVAAWESMLSDYAELQIAVAFAADELVAAGVPDHRPARLPELVGALLGDVDAVPAVPAEEYADLCRTVADGPVPVASVQHDDLHDANVFVDGGRHRFFDWGDASVSHPFLSLLIPLRMAARALEVRDDHQVLRRLRNAYLTPWAAFAEAEVLRELCDVALRVTPLQRALTWHRILLGVHPAERAEWQASVPGWAAESPTLFGPGE